MYFLQKIYKEKIDIKSDEKHTVVVILPSTPKNKMIRFEELIKEVIAKINCDLENGVWEYKVLSWKLINRSPIDNYKYIYNSDVVIAECTEKKPNVFYMIGLAHALGRPVCLCYRTNNEQPIDIPFNVYGRQSLTYSLSTIGFQKELQLKLKRWLIQQMNVNVP